METRPIWAADATLRAVWATAGESPEWIADRTTALLRSIGSTLGIAAWETPEHEQWKGPPEALADIVAKHVIVGTYGDPESQSGYLFTVSGANERLLLHVQVSAGSRAKGRRVPLHNMSIDLREKMSGGVTGAVGDTLCAAIADAWKPLTFSLSDLKVNRTARRGGWKIPVGYRTWVSTEVGEISQLEPGLSSTPLAGGTLLSAPDDWGAEDVVLAMTATLAASGLDEVPR